MLHLRGHAHHLVTVLPESPQLRHPPSSRRLVGRRKIGEPKEIPADLAEEALAEAGEEEAAPLLRVPPGPGAGAIRILRAAITPPRFGRSDRERVLLCSWPSFHLA